MYRIGLTGGIGSGKSEIARRLARRGALVVRADDIARELVGEPGAEALRSLAAEFGASVLRADGTLDRARLAALAFAAPEATARLNAVMHPPLVGAIIRRLEELEPRRGVVVVEAALLAEWDILDLFDLVVVVRAPVEARLERLARGGLSREEALARMNAQLPGEELLRAADAVVENDGTLAALETRADAVWDLVPADERNGE